MRIQIRQPGDLIFHEPFDTLDMDVWEHEITMNGGGNWEFQESIRTFEIELSRVMFLMR